MASIKDRHGLTAEEIYALAEAQGWACALSKFPLVVRDGEIYDSRTGKRVSIDHDHTTMQVRGLLTEKVNWLVDQWEEVYGELTVPREIVEYRNNPPARRVFPEGRIFKP